MKYVTSIERMAIERGLEKGMEQGMQQGGAEILLRMFQQRFGSLEESVKAHIRSLTLPEIEALSDMIFSFAARADLEVWLSEHPSSQASSNLSVTESVVN